MLILWPDFEENGISSLQNSMRSLSRTLKELTDTFRTLNSWRVDGGRALKGSDGSWLSDSRCSFKNLPARGSVKDCAYFWLTSFCGKLLYLRFTLLKKNKKKLFRWFRNLKTSIFCFEKWTDWHRKEILINRAAKYLITVWKQVGYSKKSTYIRNLKTDLSSIVPTTCCIFR